MQRLSGRWHLLGLRTLPGTRRPCCAGGPLRRRSGLGQLGWRYGGVVLRALPTTAAANCARLGWSPACWPVVACVPASAATRARRKIGGWHRGDGRSRAGAVLRERDAVRRGRAVRTILRSARVEWNVLHHRRAVCTRLAGAGVEWNILHQNRCLLRSGRLGAVHRSSRKRRLRWCGSDRCGSAAGDRRGQQRRVRRRHNLGRNSERGNGRHRRRRRQHDGLLIGAGISRSGLLAFRICGPGRELVEQVGEVAAWLSPTRSSGWWGAGWPSGQQPGWQGRVHAVPL